MRPKKLRTKATPLIDLLRTTTFSRIYGELTDYGGVRPSVTRDEYLHRHRGDFFCPRLPNYKFVRHFAGEETYYFFGNPSSRVSHTLAIIDIDVQKAKKKGSTQGAIEFVEYLRRTHWPTLCWEKSRSGSGLGCPLFVRKDGRNPREVNAMLRKLDRWLKAEARKIGADIENVEVKGTLPIISYKNGGVESIRFGQFARYPKSLTYNELSNAPILSCEEWLLMDVPETELAADVAKRERKKEARVIRAGSISGQLISDGELALLPHYERFYRKLVGPVDLKATAGFTVNAHDFAVACVLLRFFKKNPNPDGSLPHRRAKALWSELHVKGQVHRPFNDRRWTRIRNWLSEHGHIEWEDERFQAPNPAQGLNPIACKWSITDEFFDLLDSIRLHKEEASFVDSLVVKNGSGRWLSPRLFPIQLGNDINFWTDAEIRINLLFAA